MLHTFSIKGVSVVVVTLCELDDNVRSRVHHLCEGQRRDHRPHFEGLRHEAPDLLMRHVRCGIDDSELKEI